MQTLHDNNKHIMSHYMAYTHPQCKQRIISRYNRFYYVSSSYVHAYVRACHRAYPKRHTDAHRYTQICNTCRRLYVLLMTSPTSMPTFRAFTHAQQVLHAYTHALHTLHTCRFPYTEAYIHTHINTYIHRKLVLLLSWLEPCSRWRLLPSRKNSSA